MFTFLQDLRYGCRLWARTPGFTLVAVLSVALGVGANTTIFTWLKSVLLNPLPGVSQSGELLTLNVSRAGGNGYSTRYRDYVYYRDHNEVFRGLAAYEMIGLNLSAAGRPEMVMGGIVSANFFDVLGVPAAIGQTFRAAEADRRNGYPMVVLNDSYWRRRFGADPRVIGSTVLLNGHTFTILGVTPPGFTGAYGGLAQEMWVPLAMQPMLTSGGDQLATGRFPLQVMGRLLPGKTLQQAQANFNVLSQRLTDLYPESNKGVREVVFPLSQMQRGVQSRLIPFVGVLMGVVGLLLLIACMNVANLLLARATGRRKEIGVRMALGAGRGRLIRQLLTESILLSVLGGCGGLLITYAGKNLIHQFLPPLGMALGLDVSLDLRVMTFLLLVTLATGILFGLAPAWQSARADFAVVIREEAGNITPSRVKNFARSSLVAAQFALSLTALVGAGLFARSLQSLLQSDPGFDAKPVYLTSMDTFLAGLDPQRSQAFYRELVRDLSSQPGIQSASLTSYVPLGLSGGGNVRAVAVDGYIPPPNEDPAVTTDVAGPAILRTLGIPLLKGRDFTEQDREDAPKTALINEAMARQYWPGKEALGQTVRVGGVPRQVVGIFRNIKYRNLDDTASPQIYLPVYQDPEPRLTLVVRSAGDASLAWPMMQQKIHERQPDLALTESMSFSQRAVYSAFMQRAATRLLTLFSGLALSLAAIGLYGVMAYFVGQRRREIGIRLALGAAPGDVMRSVLGHSMRLTAIGSGVGILLSLALGRFLSGMLSGVSATDPLVLAAALLTMTLAALLATIVPMRRAMKVDPMTALRDA